MDRKMSVVRKLVKFEKRILFISFVAHSRQFI